PANASLNANPSVIELTFDEYITLKDVANQFVITPQTKSPPQIEASGKKVKVKFSESFLPNTTYKLSFGNAIVDLRESNNLPNFEYVFST
ncbi:Ig-like domain-containing protein, partial [Salmonella enterica]|uniref:Ig-like domain-containing protein n=1 Tax=Salmonella enterica TaxID=28901 RepID=UPI0020A3F1FE